MPDYFNKLLKWIDHNRYTVLAVVAALALTAFVIGCQATGSFRGEEVDAKQLEQMVSVEKHALDSRHDAWVLEGKSLERDYTNLEVDATATVDEILANQAMIDKAVADAGSMITGAVTGNPANTAELVGLGLGWLGLIGSGKWADKKRTDAVLAKVKTANGGKLPVDATPTA